jgi:hypothetical protein
MCQMEYLANVKTVLISRKVTQFYFKQTMVVEKRGNQTFRLSSGKTILRQLLIREIRMMMNSVMNLIHLIQMAVQLEKSNRLYLKFSQLIRAPALSLVSF